MANSIITKLAAVFFLSAVFLHFIMPIWDVDFPWHLKTGEYIYKFAEIPKADPFTNASDGSISEKFLLSQYWLAQVVFYLIFSNIGPLGIVLLRALLLSSLIIILWLSMKKTPLLLKVPLLYYTSTLFLAFAGERPQLFSFLFSLITVYILETYRTTKTSKVLLFLPLVMLVWANAHGGFIIGNVLIMVFCASETITFFLLRSRAETLSERNLLSLLGAGLVSILVSYANPNYYYAYTFAMGAFGATGGNVIREYVTPLAETWGAFVNTNIFIYWSIMGYCGVLLSLNLRRFNLTHLALFFFTLCLSLTAVRFVPFFIITGLFISGSYSIEMKSFRGTEKIRKLALPVNIVILAFTIFWFGTSAQHLPSMASLNTMGAARLYCESAVRFILSNIDNGRIYNSHSTGSYLILRLYPQFKPFIDTRSYSQQNVMEATRISLAERWEGDQYSLWDTIGELMPRVDGKVKIDLGARPAHPPKKAIWIGLLEKHKIDIIIHEASNLFSGELYPLPLSLINNKDWKLVHLDGRVMIFVKDLPKFRGLIAKYGLDKKKVYDEIGMENAPAVGTLFPGRYSSLAFALLLKGAPEKSVRDYIKQAFSLDKQDLLASYLEAYLALKNKGRKEDKNVSGPIGKTKN